MSEMVERVARAIYESWENVPAASDRTWERYVEKLPGGAAAFRKHARAAIEAMRDTTEAMWDAYENHRAWDLEWQKIPNADRAMDAMITAALQEKQG